MIEAAGGVVWRPAADDMEIVLVHRPRYDDWSLPKGKLRKGEEPVLGALREVAEESGVEAVLGPFVGEVSYRVHGKPKRVRYWAMRCTREDFRAGTEVDRRQWVTPSSARDRLSHAADIETLELFLAMPRPTWPIAIVSLARDGERDAVHGGPAGALGALLGAFGPERVVSAGSVTCAAALAPAITRHGLRVEVEPLFGPERYLNDAARAERRLVELASAGRASVVCAEPQVASGLVRRLTERDGGQEPSHPQGCLTVVHLCDEPAGPLRVAGVEDLPLALPGVAAPLPDDAVVDEQGASR